MTGRKHPGNGLVILASGHQVGRFETQKEERTRTGQVKWPLVPGITRP